ncbi:MAG: hypothetical protein HGA87_00760 [Desulfobulbaceae bacterium]|nr:hypothetical protein [Desulfobulbaceae bacterium]
MTGYSILYPEQVVQTEGKWQIRFNVEPEPATEEHKAQYRYDYIEVDEITPEIRKQYGIPE